MVERAAIAAKHGGMSIFLTSATDALAFGFGGITILPALSWFCCFACLGICIIFVLQLTIFIPILVLDEKRAEAQRYDCSQLPLCCLKSTPAKDNWCSRWCCCPTRNPATS